VYDGVYSLNKNYIAYNLCVNKAAPEMRCYGKCFLKKQQQKEEDRNQQATENKKEKFEMQPYFLPEQIHTNIQIISAIIPFNKLAYITLAGYPASIFHPPCA
jgi:hypothetical protein